MIINEVYDSSDFHGPPRTINSDNTWNRRLDRGGTET